MSYIARSHCSIKGPDGNILCWQFAFTLSSSTLVICEQLKTWGPLSKEICLIIHIIHIVGTWWLKWLKLKRKFPKHDMTTENETIHMALQHGGQTLEVTYHYRIQIGLSERLRQGQVVSIITAWQCRFRLLMSSQLWILSKEETHVTSKYIWNQHPM